MIETDLNYGVEEYGVLTDLLIDSPEQLKKRRGWKIFFIVCGVFELAAALFDMFVERSWLTWFGLVIAVLCFFMAFGGERYLVRRATLKKTLKLNTDIPKHVKLNFDEDGVTIASDLGNGNYNWDSFSKYGQHTHYIWMLRKDYRYVLVDQKKLSVDDQKSLIKYCKDNIK